MKYVEYEVPSALEQTRQILAISNKRTEERLINHLTREELNAVLDAPNPNTRSGIRDQRHASLDCFQMRRGQLPFGIADSAIVTTRGLEPLAPGSKHRFCVPWIRRIRRVGLALASGRTTLFTLFCCHVHSPPGKIGI
jgi:hypothetical protein